MSEQPQHPKTSSENKSAQQPRSQVQGLPRDYSRLWPTKDSKFRLRTALVVPFLLQILAAVGLVSYISFRAGQRSVNDLASQLRTELTARIENELNSYFSIPHDLNQINSGLLAEKKVDMKEGLSAPQFLQQAKFSPYIFGIYCGDVRGDFLGSFRYIDDDRPPRLTMVSATKSNGHLYTFYDVDNLGNRTHLIEAFDFYDPRIRPWYAAALRKQGQTWSDVYLDFSTLLPTITASQPVYGEREQIIGVCATDVTLPDDFRNFLASLQIGKTGEAFVIDRAGQIITSSTDEPLTVGEGDEATLIQATNSSEPLIQETAQFLQRQFGDISAIQTPQSLDFLRQGQRQFVQVLPFQDGKGLDWLIVVTVPEADFMARIYANAWNTLWLALAALGSAIGMGLLTARWITRPMVDMTEASERLAEGNLQQRVDDQSQILEITTLAQSFNSMAGQLEGAFNTLEDKVEERTADLAKANDQILNLNDKLKAENIRMGSELAVAKQLQQMVLPNPDELDDIASLDIAAYMVPADEIGGDYYEILHHDGIVTLAVGDVTGHGLESGILMLMTQTAVRTLQETHDQDLAKWLTILNRILYKNILRMKSERNLTLAVLNYYAGQVSLSGQHEEVLVVRADGTLERFDTMDLGLPIGLTDDIGPFVDSVTLTLDAGDGLVLYTDGITEAQGTHHEQYGLDRLCEAVSHHWSGTAHQIQQAVIADLNQFIGAQRLVDDITLLVVKRR